MDAHVDLQDALKRRQRLLEQARNAPIVDVLGVVNPPGVGGGRSRGEAQWTARFAFHAWHVAGGPLQSAKLEISRRVSHEELEHLQATIEPYSVLHIRAQLATDEASQNSIAILEQVVGQARKDVELEETAVQLQKPVTHHDPAFGVLTLDRNTDIYGGHANWRGTSVKLHLTYKEDGLTEVIEVAHALWKAQDSWDSRVRDYAKQRLIKLKNDAWRSEDEGPINENEFRKKLVLTDISVWKDGGFSFWFDDSDLFSGHSICVSGDLQQGPTGAEIMG